MSGPAKSPVKTILFILLIAFLITLYMVVQKEREMIRRGQEVSLAGAPALVVYA